MDEHILARHKAAMEKFSLDAMVAYSTDNVGYGLGYLIQSQVLGTRNRQFAVAVNKDGMTGALLTANEAVEAQTRSLIKDLRPYDEFADDPMAVLAGLLKDLGVAEGRIGLEMDAIPADRWEDLKRHLPRAKWEHGAEAYHFARMVKTPMELDRMRRASRIADLAQAKAHPHVKAGVTEREVYRRVVDEAIVQGADRVLMVQVAAGERSAFSNPTPSDYKLQKGEVVKIDVFVEVGGYLSDHGKGFVVGEASQLQKGHLGADAGNPGHHSLRRAAGRHHPGPLAGLRGNLRQTRHEARHPLPGARTGAEPSRGALHRLAHGNRVAGGNGFRGRARLQVRRHGVPPGGQPHRHEGRGREHVEPFRAGTSWSWAEEKVMPKRDEIRTIAVLGAGHGGCAAAADLTLRGYTVKLHARREERLRPLREKGGIEIEGGVHNAFVPLAHLTTEVAEAVEGADLIMLAVPSVAHADYARQLAPLLSPDRIVYLNPGHTGGCLHFVHALRGAGYREDVQTCETITLTYICRMQGPAKVRLMSYIRKLGWAAFPGRLADRLFSLIHPIFPETVKFPNVLATGLSDMNAVFHPPGMLMNAGWIESTGGDFLFYHEGDDRVGRPGDRRRGRGADGGRRGARGGDQKFLGNLPTPPGSRRTRPWRAGTSPGPAGRAARTRPSGRPPSLDDRYIHEDVGYGLVPYAELGRLAGVPTPTIDAHIHLASLAMGIPYPRVGADAGEDGDHRDAARRAGALRRGWALIVRERRFRLHAS